MDGALCARRVCYTCAVYTPGAGIHTASNCKRAGTLGSSEAPACLPEDVIDMFVSACLIQWWAAVGVSSQGSGFTFLTWSVQTRHNVLLCWASVP